MVAAASWAMLKHFPPPSNTERPRIHTLGFHSAGGTINIIFSRKNFYQEAGYHPSKGI